MGAIRLAAAFLIAAVLGGGAWAAASWDGTWAGGFDAGAGIQLIVADEAVVGLFAGNDYVDGVQSSLSADGTTLTVSWPAGRVTVTRLGDDSASAVIHTGGTSDVTVALKREP